MKPRTFSAVFTALGLALPLLAMAQYPQGDRHDHRGTWAQHDHLPPPRPDWRHEGFRHDDFRGAGPHHEFYRGGRLPPEYRSRRYVVDDWRSHHLSPPPRGYYWVQAGPDFLLVAVTTGVILDVLLSQ